MSGGILQRRTGNIFAWLTALLSLAAGTTGWGRPAQGIAKASPAFDGLPPSEIHDLFPAENIPFSAPPPVMLLSETKCDLKGNIYLVHSGSPPSPLGPPSGVLSALPVSKLSIDSKSTVAYPVPSLDGYRGVIRSDFDVGADGHVYSLLQALDASTTKGQGLPSFFIARYNDDGSLDSHFKLGEAPTGRIQPFRFAMFRDGNVLVTGTVVSGETLRPFAAVLNRAGTFVTYVKVPERSKPVPVTSGAPGQEGEHRATPTMPAKGKSLPTEASATLGNQADEHELADSAVTLSSSSFMVSAPDTNVYLLRDTAPSQLYVISSAGEVIRKFEIPPPAPDSTPTNMGMAGDNMVFISFGHVQGISDASAVRADSKSPDNLITVISPLTGEVSAVYRLTGESDAGDVPSCAASSHNFLFVGSTKDHQHLQVTRYLPR